MSVIIPARNESAYIKRAIDSAVHQEYAGQVEAIVVDNRSEDDTAAVVDSFVRETAGSTVKLLREPVAGVSRAKNTGAAAATGDVLIFLDADSVMAPTVSGEIASSYRDGGLVGSIRVLSDGGSAIDRAFFRLMEFGKVRFGIRAQMLYCDRGLFHQLGGFNSELQLGEDIDFLTRAGRHLGSRGLPPVCHVSRSEILTSPRRLAADHHLGMVTMFGRWLLAFLRIGRDRTY
jgi:glycosyltransferase involved in cell wall biosynthesis